MNASSRWKYATLAACLSCLSPLSLASTASEQKPSPDDFASYSLYLHALFDYQRKHSGLKPAQIAATSSQAEPESLEEAIAKSGKSPGYVDTSANPRSTFKSFTLPAISAQDMSISSITDALGVFGLENTTLTEVPQTTARLRADNDLVLTPNVDMRLSGDAYYAAWSQDQQAIIDLVGGQIILPEGEAQASATVSKSTLGDGGLDLTLSTKVRTNFYMIDRDGIPNSNFSGAGALAIQPIAIEFSNITSHITAEKNNRNDDLIRVLVASPNAIIMDLSGSQIGVADARADSGQLALSQQNIGKIGYFAKFGKDAQVRIAPGMKMDIKIGAPDGMRTPLATVNGRIDNISISNISLLGRSTGNDDDDNALRIGRMGISDLEIKDLQVFLDNQTLVLKIGPSSKDLGVSLERIAIGPKPDSAIIGDLYMNHIGVSNMQVSIAAH